jgi:small nuclear ribonucleoprotein (snRNP)-like protein
MFLPMDLVAKCTGQRIVVLLSDLHQVEGTLRHHESTCAIVLEDAQHYREELDAAAAEPAVRRVLLGEYETMLVNASHVQVLIPGGFPAA